MRLVKVSLSHICTYINNIQEKLYFHCLWIIFVKFAILVSGRDYGNKEKVRTERN